MKVLVITGIFPPDIGGPATYVPQIAEALAKSGHEVIVVTLSDRLDHDDTKYCFQVERLPRRTFKLWRWLCTIVKLIKLGRVSDVLFVNGLAMEAAVANLFLRKPMVHKVVGDLAWERATTKGWVNDNFEDFQKRCYGLKIEALKALRSWWTRRADKVIVPSRYLAKWVVKWGVPEERITVIYNAVELPDKVEPMPVPLKTPVKAVTVGRLVPWKRVDGLLEALKGVPDLGLVVVGDGPERPWLEQLARELGVSDRVYFAGQRSKKEALGLMAACDLLVLNSTHEGLPHVVLEAMSLGLPVVATAVGGTPELVKDGETGVLVPVEDGVLAIVLKRLVNDQQLCQALAQTARRWVHEQLSLERMVEQTEAIVLEAVRKGRR
jgi:glycosyltransferase involved in cell wall biosynthesis